MRMSARNWKTRMQIAYFINLNGEMNVFIKF